MLKVWKGVGSIMTDTIVCLVGKSGSGKTEIARQLESNGYNVIQSYTTRPERYPNEWGHKFSTKDRYDRVRNQLPEQIIAEVYYNNNYYWAESHQYKGFGTSIYVIDPVGLKNMKTRDLKDTNIISIYLFCSESTRINRMRSRGDSEDKIVSRIKNDREFFEFDENLYDVAIDTERDIKHNILIVESVIDAFTRGGLIKPL